MRRLFVRGQCRAYPNRQLASVTLHPRRDNRPSCTSSRHVDTSSRRPYHGVRITRSLMPLDHFSKPVSTYVPRCGQPLRGDLRPVGLRWLSILCGFVVLATAVTAQKLDELKPQGYVNDFAGVLSQSTKNQLTALCKEVDQKAQAQISIVTIKTLNGQPAQAFTHDLFVKWGVGPKQKDRGVMVLLAVDDRKYWTEVGYGLEPILPDGRVGGFGREAVPYLRQQNYNAAVLLMTQRVADVIAQDRGVTLATLSRGAGAQSAARSHPSAGGILALMALIFVVVTVLGPFFLAMFGPTRPTGRGSRWIGGPPIGGGWGGPFGGGGWGGG